MKKYYSIKDNNVFRYCPSCEKEITIDLFIQANGKRKTFRRGINKIIVEIIGYEVKDLIELWVNPYIAILCCNCAEQILRIKKEENPENQAYMLRQYKLDNRSQKYALDKLLKDFGLI